MGHNPVKDSMREIVKNYVPGSTTPGKITHDTGHDVKPGYPSTQRPDETGYTLGDNPRFIEVLRAASETQVVDNAGHRGTPYDQEWYKDLTACIEKNGILESDIFDVSLLGYLTNYKDHDHLVIARYVAGTKDYLLTVTDPKFHSYYRGFVDLATRFIESAKYPDKQDDIRTAVKSHVKSLLEVKPQARKVDRETFYGLIEDFKSQEISYAYFPLYQSQGKK